ncbi:GWxTD domain-containing protein [bacterium]|nr:GWxTD domain-containing protein [bacterium]
MKTISNNRRVSKVVLLCLVILFTIHVYASGQQKKSSGLPVRSRGQLIFDVDICQYQLNENKTLVEISYSLNLAQLAAKKSSADSNAVLNVTIMLNNNSKKSLTKLHERKVVSLSNLRKRKEGYNFIDMKRFELMPQAAAMELTVEDSASGMRGRVVYPLKVRKFDDSFSMSDLFFVSHVQKASGESIFKKHGVFLIPNPSRMFYVSDKGPKVFIYYEVNNLAYTANFKSYYRVDYSVYGLDGKEVLPLTSKMVLKSALAGARVEIIPIDGFVTGVYKLALSVTDVQSSESKTEYRYFQVFNKDNEKNLILPMSDQDVVKYLNQIKYIASDTELKIFKKLNSRGKQQFLLNFWKSRDPDPSTPENEFMEEHFRRLAYCKTHFQGGVNSDMGRVYIQYGPPVDKQRDFSSIEYSQPVIIWTYAIDGRSEFVFADRSGDGKYVLVHSTCRDEYSNPHWMDDLRQGTGKK